MTKYGIIPNYLLCPYRIKDTSGIWLCCHEDVQKPGYLKLCVDDITTGKAFKEGTPLEFPEDCPLKDILPTDCDKCNGNLIKDLHIDCVTCSKFQGIYKPNNIGDEWGVYVVCDSMRGGCNLNGSLMLNCFSYVPKEGDVEKEEEAAE